MKNRLISTFLTAVMAVLACIGIALPLPAFASSWTGVIVAVKVEQSTSGNVRVSIQTNTSTSCSGWGWYAFEYPANGTGPGAAWYAAAEVARSTLANFTITGTATCDASNVEVVKSIQD